MTLRSHKPLPRKSGLKRGTTALKRTRLQRRSERQKIREAALATTKARLLVERGQKCEGARLYAEWSIAHLAEMYRDHPVAVADAACTRQATDLHHKKGRAYRDSDEDRWLLLLCNTCHRLATDSHPITYVVGINVKRNSLAAAS